MPSQSRPNPRRITSHPATTEPAARLSTREGLPVPLQSVAARGRLEGLVFELTVEQRYHNASERNLEAVFTFPLPLRAVLLGFELEIGARRLSAQAFARQQASERYERAIDEGNTAALIEHDGNGLYTVSLGNLMAGESAVIRYRYAELLDAHDGWLRLQVPTVIAPRYGHPGDAGLDGPAVPNADLLAEYPFALEITLPRLADPAALHSPTHRIETVASDGPLTVRLGRGATLDRDFVLEIGTAAIPSEALLARDGDGCVLLASPILGVETAEQRPLVLKILLDCSGSMAGDSLAAAKRALLAILDRLNGTDRLSLTRFGNAVDPLTEGLEPADAHSLVPLRALVARIEADLGGTDMRQAVQHVLALPTPEAQTTDLVLITDGEIYDVDGVVEAAAHGGHRLFAIAIGAAPNEGLARRLAERTGGACEFVGPNDDAAAVILRTFQRLRAAPRTLGAIQWPTQPDWIAPGPAAVFPGDTLHLFAGFAQPPTGTLALEIQDGQGGTTRLQQLLAATPSTDDLLPRLAAARRLAGLDETAARDLALKYQLASAHTSFVVVAERAPGEKATDLPATVAVPHMLAAGWGASASVEVSRDTLGHVAACRPDSSAMGPRSIATFDRERLNVVKSPFEYLHLPAFLRRRKSAPDRSFGSAERSALLNSLLAAWRRGEPLPGTLADLAPHATRAAELISALHGIVRATGKSESEILAIFLALLAEDDVAKGLDAAFLKLLRGGLLGSRAHRGLRSILRSEVFT